MFPFAARFRYAPEGDTEEGGQKRVIGARGNLLVLEIGHAKVANP